MQVDFHAEAIEANADTSNQDAPLKVEFVEIYDDSDGELAMARNCSNG